MVKRRQVREACERQKGSYSIILRSPRQARFSIENNKKIKGGQSTDENAIYRGVSICSSEKSAFSYRPQTPVNQYSPCTRGHKVGLSAIWPGRERVLSLPVYSCSQGGMGPAPEFMKRFSGLSWLGIGVRTTTSRAAP